ncbi:hypothetical protein EYF80_049353 [Liparis tanakae]|uniref:Uncharacterized protein n=1 Tax=Liparis tanakae TaxID=230148 RepID=A0A4Z2FHS6_9TELE|nr:hypothetical protein EYF80_049353 [Liparis tanakae]
MGTATTEERAMAQPRTEYFVQDINLSAWSYQCVQSQQNEHQEKTGGPQLRQRHHGNSLRKYYECKSRPWEDRRDV